MKLLSLVGARPNFVKIAPILRCIQEKNKEFHVLGLPKNIQSLLVHSGQHYDRSMSEVFFHELNLTPDVFLGVGSGSHAVQTAKIMQSFEPICVRENPDCVLVVGDVNTTLAGGLVASKLQIPIAHVEAGLRSFDRTMPEEINRVLVDQISELLFITEKSAEENLQREGVDLKKIHFVGNVMIDSLRYFEKTLNTNILTRFNLNQNDYALVTLHRPESVDNFENFETLFSVLRELQQEISLIFPVHPRTKTALEKVHHQHSGNLRIIDPVGYLDFLALMKFSRFVITDSGGIQEETTALQIPCITVRKSTERPVTTEQGTNVITGLDPQKILDYSRHAIQMNWRKGNIPPLWDGKTAERIVKTLCDNFLT